MNQYRHNLKPWCFTPETARLLFQKFDLMDTFFHAAKTGNRVISFRRPQPGSQGKPCKWMENEFYFPRSALMVPTAWMLRQTHHAAAVSYCTLTNRVCGVVLAGSDGQDLANVQDDLINKVLKLEEYAYHPMLLPYVVLSEEADRLVTERDRDNISVFGFENKTGLRENRYTDEDFTKEITQAMQKIVERLVMITNHIADAEILERNFRDAIRQSIGIFYEKKHRKRQSQDEDADDEEALVLQSRSISEEMQLHSYDLECRFNYLFDCNTSAAASFKALQKRAEVQMEGVSSMKSFGLI